MKLLFITGANGDIGGGSVIVNRNRQILCRTLGEDNVLEFRISRKRNDIKSLFERCAFTYVVGLNSREVNKILSMSKNIDIIWIDGSFYGTLAKELKAFGFKGKIITFFHNIEKYFRKRNFFQSILYPLYNGPLIKSERNAIHYSDNIVVLTERDAVYIRKVRPDACITLLPSSMNDTFVDKDGYGLMQQRSRGRLNLLFVGSYFYANVKGISWFIDKVLPFVDAKLTIVGTNMNNLPYTNNDKLQICGFVEDLGEFYRNSDAVIAPIFEGSGMKTKTTEALMWGKYIIGTDESFCGFLIDDSVGQRCRTESDFIERIKYISEHGILKFNFPSRELFLKCYSMECSMKIVRDIVYK